MKPKQEGYDEPKGHPDLEPLAEYDAGDSVATLRSLSTDNSIDLRPPEYTQARFSDVELHPDLQLNDPLFVTEAIPAPTFATTASPEDNAETATLLPSAEPASTLEVWADQTERHEIGPENKLEAKSSGTTPDRDWPIWDTGDVKEEDFAEDETANLEDALWADPQSFETSQNIHDVGDDTADFEDPELGENFSFSSQGVTSSPENAQWEELLDLELYQETEELEIPHAEDERITDFLLLDDYAARLVSEMPSLRLSERNRLQGRFRAILAEFPFSTSFRALSRLVNNGTEIDVLEDACELKCQWRDAPWLWLHRKFDKMQRSWDIEVRSVHRNALSWKVAVDLVESFGRSAAERMIFEDSPSEWLRMRPHQLRDGERMDPRFWSYAMYLSLERETTLPIDYSHWFYEEITETQPLRSLRLENQDSEIWRFEPICAYRDSGFLSLLPFAERQAEKEKAQRKDEEKAEKQSNA